MAMRQISTPFKEGLVGGGITLLLVMTFPIVFLLFFTLRFALVAAGALALVSAIVIAIGGSLAYAFDPSVRAWVKAQAE
jgi:hypothetical protein